jgi:hypothetical protein
VPAPNSIRWRVPLASSACATGRASVAANSGESSGAGTGKLAAGLLKALDALGAQFDTYSIVDLSGELRERQRATIEAEAPALAARVRWLDALPKGW